MYSSMSGLLVFLSLFLSLMSSAQDKVLIQQVELLFKDMRSGERKVLVDKSVETWGSGWPSEKEREKITTVFNELQTLKVGVLPSTVQFAECVNAFREKDERKNMEVWLSGLTEVLGAKERRRTVVKEYLAETHRIVCREMLSSATTHQWLARGKAVWTKTAEQDIRLSFPEVNLVCNTNRDSIAILGTSLDWKLYGGQVNGRGGRVKWRSETDTIFADLSTYTIDMSQTEYSADSVRFAYPAKYPEPIVGQLKDNAYKYARGETAPFPVFSSYAMDIQVDSIFPSFACRGGVSYIGLKLVLFGTDKQPASVAIVPNDTMQMFLYSKRFSVDSTRILAGSARLMIPLEKQEFTHPDINFLYMANNHTVVIKRIDEQSQKTPFKDDYHQILFDVEQVMWPIDSGYMEMSMNNRSGLFKATVESLNFFNDNIYDNMQGLDDIHPLNGLCNLSVQLDSRTFSVAEYAGFMRRPIDQLRKQLVILSYGDFLSFDELHDEVTLKQRLFDYTESRVGRRDYDNIRFFSHPKESRVNARLYFGSNDIHLFGVDKFTISETKDIYVEPVDKSVIMKKNRDMLFNGKLKAGMFDMFGTNLFFSYDKYTIDLNHVDSTGMYLADEQTNKRGERVHSLIRNVTGDLVIDKPNNKSGKKEQQGYPIFNSTQESFVYFDEKEIRDGVYHRDSFYFVIQPYTIKDINDAGKFRYAFNGTLVSNILPDIVDTLVLLKDKSLGMNHTTRADGMRLYRDGVFTNEVTLSRKGMTANGTIDVNGSHFESSDIVMMPRTLLASTPLLKIDSVTGRRPTGRGEQVELTYLSDAGRLQAVSTQKPFSLYGGRAQHNGKVFVYNDLLDASGQLELKGATLSSQLFNLRSTDIFSAVTDLKLSSFSNKNIQLNTSNVKADIDLVANKGKFMNNADANRAEFPSNRYLCSFKSFTWYMEEAYLNIGIEDKAELLRLWKIEDDTQIPDQGKNIFVSTDRQTDSLTFIAPLAQYNLATGEIDCQWVNHVDIANGRLYPDSGNIFISSEGDIREFTKARLLCERTDSTKLLTDVRLKLTGRYRFNGGGDFVYESEELRRSTIRFSEIGIDTSRWIFAKAVLKTEDKFLLNDGLAYKGDAYLYSRQPHLFFRGFVGLTSDDTYLKHRWLKVNSWFDEKTVRVPIAIENRDDADQRIFNGMYLNVDKTVRPYASFMSKREFYNDDLVLGGEGHMAWNAAGGGSYTIADTLRDSHYYLKYVPTENTISGFGKLDLPPTCPGITQGMAGNIAYDLKEEELKVKNVLYFLDFELLKKMEGVILKDFTEKKKNMHVSAELPAKLRSLFGKGSMPVIEKQLARNSNNIPDSLDRLWVFDSMSFTWHAKNKAYHSEGVATIRNIRNKVVDKPMNVCCELVRRRVGNEIYLYLYNDQMWYYFEYVNDILYTLSSNQEYNNILQAEKAEKKVIRNKEKMALYTITLCPESKRTRFLKRLTNTPAVTTPVAAPQNDAVKDDTAAKSEDTKTEGEEKTKTTEQVKP